MGVSAGRLGNWDGLVRASRQYSRRMPSGVSESIAERSLPPLPRSIRCTMRRLSMSLTLSAATSDIRKPAT